MIQLVIYGDTKGWARTFTLGNELSEPAAVAS
jgi:hypothetical protein